jgi:hypothetical protein
MPGPARTHLHKPDPGKYPAPKSLGAVISELCDEVVSQPRDAWNALLRLVNRLPVLGHTAHPSVPDAAGGGKSKDSR